MSSRKQKTRSNILDSALRLLVERGYHGVGMEEVAKDAGVSRQAVYLHFKSKSDLLVAMARYSDEMLDVPEIVRRGSEAETALEAIDAGIQIYGLIEPQIYEVASVVYAARRTDEAAEAAWQDRMAYRRENVRRGMERLQDEGILAEGWTVDEATDFAWGLLSIHTYENLVVERGWSIEQFVDRLRTMIFKVLVKEK
jgi:AcrR family transcriptional regulator